MTTFSVKIGPNFRAGVKFPLSVNASVLTVYNGPPQTIQNPVIYGHVPSGVYCEAVIHVSSTA